LEKEEVENYCVDAGGDIRQRNALESINIGLENPSNIENILGSIKIQNQSLCGSAGNRRRWANFHHVIDPESLKSPEHIVAVWTLAKTTLLADILTTAIYFISPGVLKNHFDFEYLVIKSNGTVEKSAGFEAELFIN
jgi:thiamine biosynthesis lipoprotein